MTIRLLAHRIRRFIVEKSSSDKKILFLRKEGMKIGDHCHFDTMAFSTEPYLVEIGDHVGISSGTVFITHDAGISCFRNEFPEDDIFGKIIIGNNVFIGINCTLLPNTVVGDNCIIGAGSVVRGKVPANSVLIGNPAKVLMQMSVQRLMYRVNPGRLKTVKMTDPEKKPHVIGHFKQLRNGN
jgi:acetyltransferase-like isoleucine patch superfamily enzyme